MASQSSRQYERIYKVIGLVCKKIGNFERFTKYYLRHGYYGVIFTAPFLQFFEKLTSVIKA